MSPSSSNLQSIKDTIFLAKLAHKYDVTALVQECESYLVTKAIVNSGKALFTTVEVVVSLLILTEGCRMNKLLAHCELYMIKLQDKTFWQHPALMSDRISRQCLLRLLRGAQHHMVNSEARIADLHAQVQANQPSTVSQGSLGFGSPATLAFDFGASNPVNDISREAPRHISVNTLMEWAKTA